MFLPQLFFSGILLILVNADELQFVNLIYRHGDRSPMHTYPNSRYKEDFWEQGFGQLTQTGMRQQYKLGQFLRQKYNGFLSKDYSRYQLKVASTDVDRTLMSAECTLAGLYPPDHRQTWNNSILWQPIPVHTGSIYSHYVPNVTVCPYYHLLYKNMLKGDWLKKMDIENAEFLKNISRNAGYGHSLNMSDVYSLVDPIKVERFHNHTQPGWITDDVYSKLVTLCDAFLTYIYKQHGIQRLIGGSLLEKLVSNMDQKIISTLPLEKQRRMDMYSMHDTTIVALMSALGLYNGVAPSYGACVGVELWKESRNETYYVNLWYKNDTNADPYVLEIPGCNHTLCPYARFQSLIADVLPGDLDAACRLPFYMNEYVIIAFVSGAVFLMLLVLAVLFCRSEVKQRHKRYLIDKHGETL